MQRTLQTVCRTARQTIHDERGFQLIELIGYFPFVLLIFVFVWQIVVVGYTGIIASGAAREGARAAAVFEDVGQAVGNASPGFDGRREWTGLAGYPCSANHPVTIQVKLEVPHVSFPFVGALGQYSSVTQQATARCEPLPLVMHSDPAVYRLSRYTAG